MHLRYFLLDRLTELRNMPDPEGPPPLPKDCPDRCPCWDTVVRLRHWLRRARNRRRAGRAPHRKVRVSHHGPRKYRALLHRWK